MAQSGSASALGAEGRRFKSCCPDQSSAEGGWAALAEKGRRAQDQDGAEQQSTDRELV
jgi:hypothetical protein